MEQSLWQFGKQAWAAAERSQLAHLIRGIAETEGVTLKNAAGKVIEKAGELAPKDVVILSANVKKMVRNGGTSGAPAEAHLPTIVNFPPKPHKPAPGWDLPGEGGKSPIIDPRPPQRKKLPGRDIPPDQTRRFPGKDEEGGMPPVVVILPPKGPKNPPLRAARELELVH